MVPGHPSWTKEFADINSRRMAYVELGHGDPIVFLHGNPTSSFLWRNIAPRLADLGRCIVPDLIGMGDSDKLPDPGPESYRFVDHRRFLDGLLESLRVTERVVLVVHDWGSALGFDWARRHPDAVRGIAYMEALVCPMRLDEFAPHRVFARMRSPEGDAMVLDNNFFVEVILPRSILRTLSTEEMNEYRRPFTTPDDRRPTLTWPRQLPLDGQPADVVEIVSDYSQWLASATLPKLFINAEPGAILVGRMRELCRTWPNQHETTVAGNHFLQEDSPEEIADALRTWLVTVT